MFALEWGYLAVLVLGKCSRRNAAQRVPCGITSNMGSMKIGQIGLVPQVLVGAWWTRWGWPRGWPSNEHKGSAQYKCHQICSLTSVKWWNVYTINWSISVFQITLSRLSCCRWRVLICACASTVNQADSAKRLQVLSQGWNLTSANKKK